MPSLRPITRDLPSSPTVAELIRHGATAFDRAGLAYGHGTGNAVDEAAALVFHALDLDHQDAESAYGRHPDPADVTRVLDLLAERIERRVPAAYLMGRMWFAGLEFEVDERVIVPRSPFAELTVARFEPWLEPGRVGRVLDIGAGSGCIAVACAFAFPQARVDAIDISADALAVAARNVAKHGVGDRVRLLQGDCFDPVAGERYDLIVANPPYVSDEEMAALPLEYLHEPELALRAGSDGLAVVRRIIAGAQAHLAQDGVLIVEVGDSEARVNEAFPRLPFVWLEFEQGGGGVFLLRRRDFLN
jgi:ribosomal protein L3 glutamine methyltransferase